MKKGIAFSFFFLIASSLLFGSVYIVPKEYDNTYNSIRSKGSVLITNGTPTLSHGTYTAAGRSVRFRCAVVPKIPCRNAVPSITAAATDVVLLNTGYLVSMYGYEVVTEDWGTDWAVCGSATGGYTWDESVLTSSKDAANNTTLKYTYTPNKYSQTLVFFSSDTNRGSANAHMVIDIQQKCK